MTKTGERRWKFRGIIIKRNGNIQLQNESDQSLYGKKSSNLHYYRCWGHNLSREKERRKETRRDNDDEEWRCRNMIKPVAPLSLSLFNLNVRKREREKERKMSTAVLWIWLYERICTLLTSDYEQWMTTGDRYSLFCVKTRRRKSVASQHETKSVWEKKAIHPFCYDDLSDEKRSLVNRSLSIRMSSTHHRWDNSYAHHILIAGNKHFPITDKLWSD